jgi:hypothetical protein
MLITTYCKNEKCAEFENDFDDQEVDLDGDYTLKDWVEYEWDCPECGETSTHYEQAKDLHHGYWSDDY